MGVKTRTIVGYALSGIALAFILFVAYAYLASLPAPRSGISGEIEAIVYSATSFSAAYPLLLALSLYFLGLLLARRSFAATVGSAVAISLLAAFSVALFIKDPNSNLTDGLLYVGVVLVLGCLSYLAWRPTMHCR